MFFAGITLSPMIASMVPISPTLYPAFSRIDFTIYVVVVFPFVPVIPIVFSFSAGYPKYAAEINAIAYRVSFTRMTVTSSGASTASSTIRTFAPFATTSGTNLWPSTTAPRIQIKREPSSTFRES